MRIAYAVATTFAIVVASCVASDETKCTEGESYKKDCNTCTCTSSGVYACTLMLCLDLQESTTTQSAEVEHSDTTQTNNQVCTPNEIKMEDCNRCKCAANGIGWFCTRQACPPSSSPPSTPQKRAVNSPGFTCTPNETFMDNCNTCRCDSTGTIAACTEMACLPYDANRQKRSHIQTSANSNSININKDCVPGTTWKNQCNFCRCSPTGLALCTRRYCPTELMSIAPLNSESKSKRQIQNTIENADRPTGNCVPGTKWMNDCNRCWCSKNGYAACTRMFCGSPSPNINFKPAPGFDNQLIKSGDNDNKEIFRRKREDSVKAPNTNKNSCEPKTSWFDGCNRCFCSDNGVALCTLMICINTDASPHDVAKNVRKVEEEAKKCEPGKVWMEDCNKCHCSLKGTVQCSSRSCEEDDERIANGNLRRSKRQLPKENGRKLLLNQKEILETVQPPVEYHQEEEFVRIVTPKELYDPNFRCDPHIPFKVDCNTCWCSSNGREARLCTRIACKPKTYPPLNQQQ